MTRSAEDLSRDENIDLKVLVEFIKNDLFPKAKFILGKNEWDLGGTIYNDYIKCCHGIIGLQTMTDVERCKIMLHGDDMDESSDQEYAEKGTSSEKKLYIHSHAK